MMQNGFRRIALAQGLLPERLASRELPASVEPAAASCLSAAEAAGLPAGPCDGDSEMLLAGAAYVPAES